MKKIFTLLFFSISALGNAQLSNDVTPMSWGIENLDGLAPIIMPSFDLETLQKEDLANRGRMDIPYRFGYEFIVDYNLMNSGDWETLENGDRIWRIRFYSPGAKTMNFLFSYFYMPQGAHLILYSNDRKDVLGAYDAKQNNPERVLGTWLVTGEDIWLEYYEPKAHKNQGRLEVYKLVHGYRSTSDILQSSQETKALNSSGNCHYDVNCTMGAIDATKNINKKAVGMVLIGGGLCSGALVNNTSNDGTPYFLTANHCYEDENGTPHVNPSQWSFRFNWISNTPSCASTAASLDNADYYTVSGAELKAHRTGSDFCLVAITGPMDADWELVYAGWDRSTTAPLNAYGIHHPDGDIMKVSVEEDSPSATAITFGAQDAIEVWHIANWEKGVTEGGSSGSPLFDNNGRIRGQLFGGLSACTATGNGITGNGQYDIYGRFDISWSAGATSSERLSDWLDPAGTNQVTLDYLDATLGIDDVAEPVHTIRIYPNPSNGIFSVALANNTLILEYQVYNTLGQVVASGTVRESDNSIDMSSKANGVYVIKFNGATNNTITTHRIVKE